MGSSRFDAPLSGLRVIELARILAGPWIGQILADLGADVIKVENPQGDDTRRWGPPFIEHKGERVAAYFHCCNRGKRSIVADFNDADDLATVKELIGDADVVIENFRFGSLARFGLDYESVSSLNPGLIYASVTGFGQTGPHRARPGYDFLIQGMGGAMSITGPADGEPQKMGVAFADIFTGLYGVIGIQAALAARERDGVGQHVDLSLLDCMVGVLANQAANYLIGGQTPTRMGNAHPSIVPYQVFACRDGHIIIAAGNNRQYRRLCEVLDRSDLATDPSYTDNGDRVERRDVLINELQHAVNTWSKAELLAALEAVGVPCGPINTIPEVFDDPQVIARGLQVSPEGVPGVRTPITFSTSRTVLERAAPALGEHTEAIRKELAERRSSSRQRGDA